jgi:hypothetical protein
MYSVLIDGLIPARDEKDLHKKLVTIFHAYDIDKISVSKSKWVFHPEDI